MKRICKILLLQVILFSIVFYNTSIIYATNDKSQKQEQEVEENNNAEEFEESDFAIDDPKIHWFDYSEYDYWTDDENAESEGSYLGIIVSDAQIEGRVDRISGAYVEGIRPYTPVSICGLTEGDLITAIDGYEITCIDDLRAYLQTVPPYTKVTIEITWVNTKGYYKTTTYKTRTLDTRIFQNVENQVFPEKF